MDSLTPRTEFNRSGHPVVDPNGKAFTPGCRVRFCIQSHYINRTHGEGVFQGIDRHGGCIILADQPVTKYAPSGLPLGLDRTVYTALARHANSGPHQGKLVTEGELGDPHEHGTVRVFIEVIE